MFSLPVVPRYAEVDQQGVVFNGHYLTWFDEACTGFLDHLGVTYPGLIATGHDVQVVHSEIDYLASVRWRDAVRVAVQCERIGSTSFTLGFTVLRHNPDTEEQAAVRGHNVYVVVSTDDWAKRLIPARCERRSLRTLDITERQRISCRGADGLGSHRRHRLRRPTLLHPGPASGTVNAWAMSMITSATSCPAWPSNSTWPTQASCRSVTARS